MSEPDRVTEHTKITGHVSGGLALLMQRFQGKPAIEGLLGSYLTQVQALENALWQLLTDTLDSAEGTQLNQLGSLLGEPRYELDDDDFRTILRAQVLALRSEGTAPDLLALAELLIPEGYMLTEYFPAALVVEASEPPALPEARILALLQRATAAGVGMHLVVPPGLPGFPGDAFTFASGETVETDADHGWSDVGETTGGALAGVLE